MTGAFFYIPRVSISELLSFRMNRKMFLKDANADCVTEAVMATIARFWV